MGKQGVPRGMHGPAPAAKRYEGGSEGSDGKPDEEDPVDGEGARNTPTVLVASALDPSGGAGALMDAAAVVRAGAEPALAMSGIALQDSRGSGHVEPAPLYMFRASLGSIIARCRPLVVKCGALLCAGAAEALAREIEGRRIPLVLDPVTTASSGLELSDGTDVMAGMVSSLVSGSLLVTPNIPEARSMAEALGAADPGDATPGELAAVILSAGARAVLIKGGHVGTGGRGESGAAAGTVTDELHMTGGPLGNVVTHSYVRKRLPIEVHGTGCALSSLIAGRLACLQASDPGSDGAGPSGASEAMSRLLPGAVAWAHWQLGRWMADAAPLAGDPGSLRMPAACRPVWSGVRPGSIRFADNSRRPGPMVDGGANPAAVGIPGGTDTGTFTLMADEYVGAMVDLLEGLPPHMVPEVGSNMSYALPRAVRAREVMALDSRIVRRGEGGVVSSGEPEMGGSHHTARIVLAAMAFDPSMRCALNVRYRSATVDAAREAGMRVVSFSREDQPEDVSTMEWGTEAAIGAAGGTVPDVIYDLGGQGKEPMMRVLGKGPADVVGKVKRIARELAR